MREIVRISRVTNSRAHFHGVEASIERRFRRVRISNRFQRAGRIFVKVGTRCSCPHVRSIFRRVATAFALISRFLLPAVPSLPMGKEGRKKKKMPNAEIKLSETHLVFRSFSILSPPPFPPVNQIV